MTNNFNDIRDSYQRNMFAAAGDKVDMLALYKQLPDVTITGEYAENLYHLAAGYTDAEAVFFLKEAGLKAEADKYGNTAMHALINARFDFDDPNHKGMTAMDVAIYHNNEVVVEQLMN
ncbi:hypothetical protein SAMN06265348_12115 [Pedobacter westerhofensis]|uniref:Ankyrin repeat-containing protein n=1 Tax=Pedobacter westerhofensis TaxID=425512 RepID=A0A521FT36_9SPHI|nr:ankyrin repeat domain-containing protein [Pedobacter westerhofensis]SMO99244.1 hypothetical protein SAMN06265348_12115 [Pedobacter westerhofensis]